MHDKTVRGRSKARKRTRDARRMNFANAFQLRKRALAVRLAVTLLVNEFACLRNILRFSDLISFLFAPLCNRIFNSDVSGRVNKIATMLTTMANRV